LDLEMSARTCQYCGKPLSRIWVGAGEFCSREHRNQYRMRRGMDRLLEANQVASVMRRRENPKAISSLHAPADLTPRALETSSVRFLPPWNQLAVPRSRWSPPVRLPISRGPLKPHPRTSSMERREFGMLQELVRQVPPGVQAPSIEPPGASYLNRTRQPRRLQFAPQMGVALRVSAAAGFRLSAIQKESIGVPALRAAVLKWPERPLTPALPRRDRPAAAATLVIPLSPRATGQLPAVRPRIRQSLVLPGVLQFGASIHNGKSAAARAWGPVWTDTDIIVLRPVIYRRQARGTPGLVTLPPYQLPGDEDPRLALVPLTPQELPFRYSPVISAAIDHHPPAETPSARLEEHFDSGWNHWIGGTEDWRMDAAGVRTGSLALFKPSLGLADYELEFLARIDNRSVRWVFRACGFDDYYEASIATAAGGGYEFSRHAVIKGVAEPAAADAVRFAGGARTSFTVRLQAAGSQFAVSVDGRPVASWTDGRLSSGGVGFRGAADDRARLYWVRVSSSGGPAKEQSLS